jgi:hypothetical protein
LTELSIAKPNQREAVMLLAHNVASEIASGTIAPYAGAKQIWDLTLSVPIEPISELDPFIYAASEWEDRPEDRVQFERDILSEAQALTSG